MNTHRRILVIANETCAGAAVCDEVRYRAGHGPATVLVVSPALAGSRMGHWLTSNVVSARNDATVRLENSVSALRAVGLDATGQLGDADPMQALDDAFRTFAPDEILIATHPPARSNWLERRVVQRARERYDIPITHVVVDLLHEAAMTHADPRPAPRVAAETVTLYRTVDYEEALAVHRSGFSNIRNAAEGRSGVVFSTTPVQAGDDDAPVFVVEVPVADVAPYALSAQEGQYVLPAELVNRHNPRSLVTDWSE
jgi:LmbE family N-acetylglucosaminyl deacetylase